MITKRTPLMLATVIALGCSEGAVAPTAQSDGPRLEANVAGVTHRATVGGPDACVGIGLKPGCDANFSLVALEGPTGVKGQWHDQFARGGAGADVAVDCLDVVANDAWISGLDRDRGLWLTRVRDNGTTANDPPDQISFSFGPFQVFPGFDCHQRFDLPLFIVPQGQVVVQ